MDEIYSYWVGPGLLSFPLYLNTPDIVDEHNAAKVNLLDDHGDYLES